MLRGVGVTLMLGMAGFNSADWGATLAMGLLPRGEAVNGEGQRRVPREVRRRLRAALHNLEHGKPLREGESYAHLVGLAAFVHMTDPKLGGALLERIAAVATAQG